MVVKSPPPVEFFPFPEITYFFYGKYGTMQNVQNSTNNLFVIIKVYSVNYRKIDNSFATKTILFRQDDWSRKFLGIAEMFSL